MSDNKISHTSKTTSITQVFYQVFRNRLLIKSIWRFIRHLHRCTISEYESRKIKVLKWRDLSMSYLIKHSYHHYILNKTTPRSFIERAIYNHHWNDHRESRWQKCMPKSNHPQSLEVLIFLYDQFGDHLLYSSFPFRAAIEHGRLDMIEYIHNNQYKHKPFPKDSLKIASKYGKLDIIKFIHNNRTEVFESGGAFEAVKGGFIEIVKFIHFNRTQEVFSILEMDDAASNGHLDIVMFLHSNRTEGCTDVGLRWACYGGHIEVVKFLLLNRTEQFTSEGIELASRAGHLEIVKFIYSLNRPELCSNQAMMDAIESHRLEIVKFLHYNRTQPMDINKIDLQGDNATIQFLLENRSQEIDVNKQIEYAINNKDLKLAHFINDNRCDGKPKVDMISLLKCICWDSCLMLNSVSSNNFDELKYLLNNDIGTYETDVMDDAAYHGNMDILQFLHFNRTEGCTTKAMDFASGQGHLDVVKFLHNNRTEGCTTNAMDSAADNGYLDIVMFLHHNRTEGCTHYAMTEASKYGHLEVVKFLHFNRTEGHASDLLFDLLKELKHYEIVEFIINNRIEYIDETLPYLIKYHQYHHFELVINRLYSANEPNPLLNKHIFNRMIEFISNDIDSIQYLDQYLQHHNPYQQQQSINNEIWNGTLNNIAYEGNIEVFQYIEERKLDNKKYITTEIMDTVIRERHFNLFVYLDTNYPHYRCSVDGIRKSLGNGKLFVKYVLENRTEVRNIKEPIKLPNDDRIHNIKYLHTQTHIPIAPLPLHTIINVVSSLYDDNLDFIKHIVSKYSWSQEDIKQAYNHYLCLPTVHQYLQTLIDAPKKMQNNNKIQHN